MNFLKLSLCLLIVSILLVPSICFATLIIGEPITNDNIQTAVNAWITNPSTATTTYGHISTWDVSAVTDMENLFKETSFNDDIGNWNVANVKNMFCMFTDATAFNQDISGWDVSSVTNMQRIFQGASDFNSPLDAWGDHLDPTKINKIAYLFKNAEDFNQPLSSWDVSGVTNMQGMFEGASAFDQDISAWDVSAMLNMNGVFKNAIAFNQDLGDWGSKMGQVNNLSYIFNGATAFEGTGEDGGVSTWDVSNATNMARMFMNADNFNGDIGSWDVSTATNMERLFLNATSFNQDLSSWCVENIVDEPISFALNSGLATENYPDWGNCEPIALTITGITGGNKIYDGTTAASASGTAILSGVEAGDDVFLGGSPVFTFASANVGTGVTINTSGYTINGTDAGNYTLTQPTLSGDITAKELTITGITGGDKEYDGTTVASASGTATLSGVETGDDVIIGGSPVFTFASANVGTDININTSGYTINGTDSGNYTLTQPTLSASINPAAEPLTIYSFLSLDTSAVNVFSMTTQFEQALDSLSNHPSAPTVIDRNGFLSGHTVGNKVFLEYSIQQVVDSINALNGISSDTLDELDVD